MTTQELANEIQDVAEMLPIDFTAWAVAQDLTILGSNIVTEAEALAALRILKADGKAIERPTGTWSLL